MRARRLTWLWLALGGVLLTGCPDNSFLELEICLPARQDDGYTHARVQIRRLTDDVQFDNGFVWAGSDDKNIALRESGPAGELAENISVEATKENIDVGVKVRFCTTILCDNEDTLRENRFQINDPFVIGERSRATLDASTIPFGLGAVVPYTCSNGKCVPQGESRSPVCGAAPSDADVEDANDLMDAGDSGAL